MIGLIEGRGRCGVVMMKLMEKQRLTWVLDQLSWIIFFTKCLECGPPSIVIQLFPSLRTVADLYGHVSNERLSRSLRLIEVDRGWTRLTIQAEVERALVGG